MFREIPKEGTGLLLGEAELVVTDELRPPETVGAIGVAGLCGRGEDQDGLAVFVLNARQRGLLFGGRGLWLLLSFVLFVFFYLWCVEGLLIGRVGVEIASDLGDDLRSNRGSSLALAFTSFARCFSPSMSSVGKTSL